MPNITIDFDIDIIFSKNCLLLSEKILKDEEAVKQIKQLMTISFREGAKSFADALIDEMEKT